MAHQIPLEIAARTREAFLRALETAVPAYELGQLHLFLEEDEKFIRNEVERRLYEPLLPNAGRRERKWVERLKKMARDTDWPEAWRANQAARAWEALLPANPKYAGRYYIRHPIRPNNKAEYQWYTDFRQLAQTRRKWDWKWFAQMMLDGLPEGVSDFRMEAIYLLKKCDGTKDRLVRLVNMIGEMTGVEVIDAEGLHAPQKFRKWCLSKGNYAWSAGEKEIQKLHEDINHQLARREVEDVAQIGWLPLGKFPNENGILDGLWFNEDCVYHNGKLLLPDEDGIYWVAETGYRLAEEGRENPFHQKKPRMHPPHESKTGKKIGISIADCPLQLTGLSEQKPFDLKGDLPCPISVKEIPVEELLPRFYRETCMKLWLATGREGAWLVIGSFLSFLAAPELFGKYGYFPGLWVHGQQGSGKSTLVGWGMEFYGIHAMYQGLLLRSNSTTPTGLLQMLDQISNLPAWIDEFRSADVHEDKIAVIHNAFNRGGQAKYNPSRIQRAVRTAFIVSGESTMQDSALRGRYPHIQISKSERWGSEQQQKEISDWIEKHRKYFFLFGRFLMENREEFVTRTMSNLARWEQEEIDPRLKIVHGVGYSAFRAMAEMLPVFSPDEINDLRTFVLSHTQIAEADVNSETNINVFFDELLNAWKEGELSPDCFRVEYENKKHPPDKPNQDTYGWRSYKLLFDPEAVMSQLQIYLTRKRAFLPLKRKDLRDQLSKNKYWLGGNIPVRMGPSGKMTNVKAWGIALDEHHMGYQPITDEAWVEWLKSALDDDNDPRQGPLYSIVNGLKNKSKE